MVINWYGEGCFRIQSGETILLVDPFGSETGLTPPRFKATIAIMTHVPYPIPYEKGESVLVRGPGEYEADGVEITGWKLENGRKEAKGEVFLKTAYLVKFEEMRLGFVGYAAEMPAPDAIEGIAKADILFIPGGGYPYLSQGVAAKIVKQVNPKIVIPSLFKISGLKRKADDVKEFLDEFGEKPKPEEKLTIKKKDLPQKTRVALLTS